MTTNRRLFTSESVTEGHPDKMADQISDAILDEILKQDPYARVACETLVTTGMVLITGEITSEADVDIQEIVRQTIKEIGYTKAEYGFDAETCAVLISLDEQSPDIAEGINHSQTSQSGKDTMEGMGAGDQGLMFGFACDETEEYMPLPIALAHRLAKRLADIRKEEIVSYLRPDGKTQVTVEYDENNQPLRVDTIIISTQHCEGVASEQIEADLIRHVVQPIVPENLLDQDTKYLINPTGRFVIGGPMGDVGLTGRKIIVDTYGGYARHGGGAFSGKDATKVDRSAAYAARYVAKNIVAAKLAKKCEVQLAYAIGVAKPVSITVNTFGTNNVREAVIEQAIDELFDLRPEQMIEMLHLREPIFKNTAAYGHFGRTDQQFPWEKTDQVNKLSAYIND